MVNIDDFIKRLEIILEFYSLSASGFADKIGVQRSSLSHLLSGRNKPSLDFILKITEIFPEVDLYWILNGKGNFPKSDKFFNSESEKKPISPSPIFETKINEGLFSEIDKPLSENSTYKNESIISESYKIPKNENVERIVFFFKDGTFSEYSPR
jgi:transcriptional regulator with XRE-family HTH domain